MLCPVCKTECGSDVICKECRFDQIQVEFLNREEADAWLNDIVLPYRETWQSSQLSTDIDWKEILFRQKEIRYFFDVTIPAATSQNETLGHTLLICPYKRLRDSFIEELRQQLPYRNVDEKTTTQKMKMGDFAAILSGLMPGDICVLNVKSLPTEKSHYDNIRLAFKEFSFDIIMGKGVGARSVRIDLAAFTWLAVENNISDVPDRYRSVFENVLEVKADNHEMCILEALSVANEMGIKMHKTAAEQIALQTSDDVDKTAICVKRINDFMLVKGMEGKVVTEELTKDILSQFI